MSEKGGNIHMRTQHARFPKKVWIWSHYIRNMWKLKVEHIEKNFLVNIVKLYEVNFIINKYTAFSI